MHKEQLEFIETRYNKKFPDSNDFDTKLEEYNNLKAFPANGNIFDSGQTIDNKIHFIIRTNTQYFLNKAFDAMLIEMNDPNVFEDFETGNISSMGRISKVWCGSGIDDSDELGCGRFSKPVRIATFPNNEKSNIPITKRISITANCSHHFLAFSTAFDEKSYAVVSYIPDKFVLGISKLQRLADYVCRRFWLQEDLTKALYHEISKAAQTKDVYIGLFNIKHTCEWLRGAKNPEGGFTSEFYDGAFNDSELRKSVIRSQN